MDITTPQSIQPIVQMGVGSEEDAYEKNLEKKRAVNMSEGEDERHTKRKRESSDTKLDPFAIPPSSCDATVFGIQHPFVEVVFSQDFKPMEGDKVRDRRSMDRGALKAAITGIGKEYVLATKSSRASASELAHTDLHVALAKSFWRLTRPRRSEELNVHDMVESTPHKDEEIVNSFEEIAELDVVSGELDIGNPMCTDCEDRSTNDSLDVRLEGDEGEGQEKMMKRVKYDIKFQVYDERIKGTDRTVVVLIVECKWGSLAVEDIFQVGAYACEVIKTNLQKGRFGPVHLEVWNETSWSLHFPGLLPGHLFCFHETCRSGLRSWKSFVGLSSLRYAVLYPAGLVVVKDQEAIQVKASKSSKSRLTSLLKVRKQNSEYCGFEYPDGEYLEGILHISNEKYALPGTCLRGSLLTVDSQLFYESKLRMIVGDKVLQWTVDDVKDALRVRKEALNAEFMMLLDDE